MEAGEGATTAINQLEQEKVRAYRKNIMYTVIVTFVPLERYACSTQYMKRMYEK